MEQNRLQWKDVDWATYLGCSVQQVQEYKKTLDENFVTAIERNKKTKKYSFAMYRYNIAPSGHKRLLLMLTHDKQFNDISEALDNANGLISCMELTDFWAREYNMPKRAIQMMLIREK